MQYTTYLRWGVIAGVFLVLITPFLVAGSWGIPPYFFPFITAKNFTFRILVELSLLLYVILALREPKYRPRPSLIMWAVLGLVVWMGLSTITSVDPIKSFWSNFERMDGYVNLLHLFAWFVITGAVLTAENLWGRFINTSIGLSAVQGLVALLQVMHLFGFAPSSQSGIRADTTFGNATYLAVFMLFNIFLTLFMLAGRLQKGRLSGGWQALYGLALVLQFAGLFFTETRGAQLGVIGGLIVSALWIAVFAGANLKAARRYALYTLGGLAVLIAVFIGIRDTQFVQSSSTLSRLASISLSDSTIAARIHFIWPTAIKGIMEKPVTGWGAENFSFVFNKYYEPGMYNQEQWFDRAHNQFLDFGIAGGVPALLLYLSLFFLGLWALWRSNLGVAEQAVLVGLLAAYGFNNLAVFDNVVSFIYFFALMAYLHSISRKELPGWLFLSRKVGEQPLAIAAPVLAILILGAGFVVNAPAMARASQLVQALGSQSSADKNLALFAASLENTKLPGNPIGLQEAVEQLSQFSVNTVAPSSVAPGVKQQYFSLTAGNLEILMQQRRHDARLELFMGLLLSTFGDYQNSISYLNQALADSPKKQQILMQLGLTQIQSGQLIDAVATLRTAFESEKNYDTARVLYASAYYYAGDTAQGDALLIEKWGSVVVDNDQLMQVYTNTKQWSRAVAIWKLRISKDDTNVQLRLGLAGVYFASGDNASTIAELRAVAKLQPASAGQMETLIKQIQDGTLKP